jgi:hypothetical protein
MLAGAVAGFLTGQSEKADTKGNGARAGAISGAIAGAIIIIGQLLGAIGALIFLQQTGTKPIFGSIPSPNAPAEMQAVFYLTGAGTGLCFGLIGTALAALGGAGGGYFGTPDRPGTIPPANFQI